MLTWHSAMSGCLCLGMGLLSQHCTLTVTAHLSSAATNREEVELLLPPLEPQYCVEQAMNAILIDQPLVCIPRLTYLPVISRA